MIHILRFLPAKKPFFRGWVSASTTCGGMPSWNSIACCTGRDMACGGEVMAYSTGLDSLVAGVP
jgi:hypothetical protein